VGDLGKTAKVALWLSTSATAIQPHDYELQPGGTWVDVGASPTIAGLSYYNWVNTSGAYITGSSTPGSTNTTAATWSAVPVPNGTATPATQILGNGLVYLHISYYLPRVDTDSTTNNAVQGIKLYSDFLFTLRQQ
jgi:hypothetical protein